MNKSIASIALVLATAAGAASAAPTQSALIDATASTSASTIWTNGELGYVQNPHFVAVKAVANSATECNVTITDSGAKTSPSTIWTYGELGYIQNPQFASLAKVDASAAQAPRQAVQVMAQARKDLSVTY